MQFNQVVEFLWNYPNCFEKYVCWFVLMNFSVNVIVIIDHYNFAFNIQLMKGVGKEQTGVIKPVGGSVIIGTLLSYKKYLKVIVMHIYKYLRFSQSKERC